MAVVATLAVITTTPAAAQTTTVTALSVVNPGNQRFIEFDPVQLQITATGGTAPYTWSATGLSTWLSINPSTGLISGIATAGLYTVTVTAVDATGASASATFTTWCPRECRTC